MAASRDLRSLVTDVVTCSICLELFNSPKSLPCLHTFCLKCIEGHCRDNDPGVEVACPVCRQKFKIPDNGAHGLLNNFFVADLVEARRTASDVLMPVPCDECSSKSLRQQARTGVTASTMYCVDCNRTLCDKCSRPHRRMKGGPHKLVQIATDVKSELADAAREKCDKHDDDDAALYCFDCAVNMCKTCFVGEHKQHSCTTVDKVAVECVRRIDADIETVKERVGQVRKVLDRLEVEKRKFLVGVEEIGEKIFQLVEKLKQQIDKQVNELLLEVQSQQKNTCKEIESCKNNAESMLLDLETFIVDCLDVKRTSDPCDMTRTASDLRTRTTELMQITDVTTLTDYWAPDLSFEPDGILNFLGGTTIPLGAVNCKPKSRKESATPFAMLQKDTVRPGASTGTLETVTTAGRQLQIKQQQQPGYMMASGASAPAAAGLYHIQPMYQVPQPNYYNNSCDTQLGRPLWVNQHRVRGPEQLRMMPPVVNAPYRAVQLAPPPPTSVFLPIQQIHVSTPANVNALQGTQRQAASVYGAQYRPHTIMPPPNAQVLTVPLTANTLAEIPPIEHKQVLGERLFPLIHNMYPDIAGKITGMLLELDNSELLHLLESRESLKAKVEEAVAVIHAYQASLVRAV